MGIFSWFKKKPKGETVGKGFIQGQPKKVLPMRQHEKLLRCIVRLTMIMKSEASDLDAIRMSKAYRGVVKSFGYTPPRNIPEADALLVMVGGKDVLIWVEKQNTATR